MTEQSPIFTSRRRPRLPVLVLTAAMQRDAFQMDRDRALRCNRRDVARIEAEARRVTLEHLRRK